MEPPELVEQISWVDMFWPHSGRMKGKNIVFVVDDNSFFQIVELKKQQKYEPSIFR